MTGVKSTAKHSVADKDELGLDLVYTALVAYPDLEQARTFMHDNGYDVSVAKLKVFREMRGRLPGKPGEDMFIQKRKELAPILEKIHADDLLDTARSANAVTAIALERTREKLERNEYQDPATVARNSSQVATQSVDKRMLLEDRPTVITATRTPEELVNALVAMKVAERVQLGDVTDTDAVEIPQEAG